MIQNPAPFLHHALGLFILAAAACVTALIMCGLVRRHLAARNMLDTPNARSLHAGAVPRGGGLGLWLAVLPLWLTALALQGRLAEHAGPLAGMSLLIVISWLDDKKSLSPLLRLGAHAVAVALGLFGFGEGQLFFQGLLPFIPDRLVAALAWLWFINLTNFMDGIDGISGVETVHVSAGFLLLSLVMGLPVAPLLPLAACLAGAALGFLVWNWPPAKLFLGDVGSVPLGFLLGYLMLALAAQGFLAAAFVLPLYYVTDATWTLLRRIVAGKKFWQPHREHFYQKAALAAGHARVVKAVMLCNAVLLLLALISLKTAPFLLLAAPLPVAGLVWYLMRLERCKA